MKTKQKPKNKKPMELKFIGYGEWMLIDRTGSYGTKATFYRSKQDALAALRQEAALKGWLAANPLGCK